jgi:SagB-type dehydrogenase family enzyme
MENKVGKEFLEMTKYQNLGIFPQKQGVPMPPIEMPLEENAEIIELPKVKNLDFHTSDFSELIEKRQSLRKYADEPITLEELAFLLWGTQGVKTVTERDITFRTVPSAGSRHPFETYLLVNHVTELTPGLYRYMAINHNLAKLDHYDSIREDLTNACLKQSHVFNSAVTFAWVAVPERTTWRYGNRGYRYIYLDAGHVCQNLYLLAESVGCGVCAIAAFDDDLVNQALSLDGDQQFVIYLASLGKRVAA